MSVDECWHVCGAVQGSEDKSQEPGISFYLVGPGNGAQAIRLTDMNLYPLNYLLNLRATQ